MDREELTEAVEKYRDTVFRIAYGYTGSFEDSEDISQDVFLKLFKSNKRFVDEEHKKAWLIRVAINASKSALRSSWRQKRADMPPESVPYYSDVQDRELFDCVMRLPPKYRAAVYLYYYEDYPVTDVARLMGISRTAVTTRLARAREQLKRTFAKEEMVYER
ncbi:MAG: RNA polymerase sigma factor [Oscillospiraceae bacterium]|jgi:RNA polymerase sigma-70 factor (ECF subfamily)|nr:RNA polymerase sigma factor [Oscillospiraceae bacterium]